MPEKKSINIHIHEKKQSTRNRQVDPMDSEKVLWFNPKFGYHCFTH